MIEIINHERRMSKNSKLQLLNMRVGIHTGRIVGGIVGTKLVRYDIFGPDVLIANKMESRGEAGSVIISASTHSLLKRSQWSDETLAMEEYDDIEIDVIGKSIKSYKV